MQLTIDIPEQQIGELDRLTVKTNASREEIVQQALRAFLITSSEPRPLPLPEPLIKDPEERDAILEAAFGSWKDFPEDGLEYQQRLRKEWVREWDPEWTDEKA